MHAFCETYNELYSEIDGFTEAKAERTKVYDFKDECPLIEDKQEVHSMFDRDIFFDNLKVKKDCIDVLHKYKHRLNIKIVTIGQPKNLSKKILFIEEHLPFIQDIILISNGSNQMDKSVVDMKSKTMTPNIFIDDHRDNLMSSNADIKLCMASYGDLPWNEGCEYKLSDWEEVDEALRYYVQANL